MPQDDKPHVADTAEGRRLAEAEAGGWRRWGPYLSERAWGTVREDYSASGDAWDYLPHDHARSRAFRWSEDGIAGFSDQHQRWCLALALWNGRDPDPQGAPLRPHQCRRATTARTSRSCYYYLDGVHLPTPTCGCSINIRKRPFPYDDLHRTTNARRNGVSTRLRL